MADHFGATMRLMRKHDPQTQEDAFATLRTHAAEYVDRLIEEFHAERDDRGLRSWLLELVGESRSPAALPLLVEQLNGDNETLRWWAVVGLEKLGSPEARQALWRAKANGLAVGPPYPES